MHTILDVRHNVGEFAHDIFKAGFRTIIRSFDPADASSRRSVQLTPTEAARLSEAGLNVSALCCPTNPALKNYGEKAGVINAVHALECAEAIGQPGGSAIYFAIEGDICRASQLDRIKEYLVAVRETLNGRFLCGVQCSGHIGRELLESALVDHVWLAHPLNWMGSPEFLASQDWTLHQLPAQTWPKLGFRYHPCRANPGFTDFGQFSLSGACPIAPEPDPASDDSIYQVISRSGVNLRKGPAADYDVGQTLESGTHIFVQCIKNGWARVDLNGDGLSDGYLFAGYIEPVVGGEKLDYPVGATPYQIAQIEMAHGMREYAARAHNPRIYRYHLSARKGAREDVAWCSSFVNHCVASAGYKGTDSKWALTWEEWGMDAGTTPREGDIAVWERRCGSPTGARLGGYVGFVVSIEQDHILALGANPANQIKINRLPIKGNQCSQYYLHKAFRRLA